jgi:hypothetical protein
MTSLSFSLGGPSSKPSQRPSPPPTKRTNGTKRDHATLLDDASDDEDATHTKRQTITHFDTTVGGAINAKAPKKEEKTPLVITALANRDWREASKRQRAQKYGISAEQLDARRDAQGSAQGNAQGADTVVEETDAVRYGLNVFAPSSTLPEDIVQEEQQQEEEVPQHKTQDQLAIDALTGAAPTSTLTIPAAAATEEDAFASTFHSAPPAPSLSDYTAVPVEEYGAAMLRGMGWKGPSAPTPSKPGKKPLPQPKRPALLGIGADPNAAKQAEELGAWGKTSSRQRGKEPAMFIPVSMKNKRTGETLTEEELKQKIRKDKEEAENQRFIANDLEIRGKSSSSRRDDGGSRRKDEYEDDQEERRRRRDKERDREKDYDRHDRAKDHRDRRDRSRDHRDSKRDSSRDRYDKKSSSHRRDRSRSVSKSRDHDRRDRDYDRRARDVDHDRRDRDKDYERRDKPKDYERREKDRREHTNSGKRDRYEDTHKSSSRRERDGRDGEGYRSSRR